MSHFNFENDINNIIRVDAPLSRGAQMRWNNSSGTVRPKSISGDGSLCNLSALSSSTLNANTTRSPGKRGSGLSSRTPSKTPGKGRHTPCKGSKTPTTGGDRFIPNRGTTQFEFGHYQVSGAGGGGEEEEEEMMSPSRKEFQTTMNENLNGESLNSKIISYRNKAPSAPEGYQNTLKVLYNQSRSTVSCKKSTRHIPQVPERILDAPQILDDYYLNLLDWSVNGQLAVCLAGQVYLWSASNGVIQQLLETDAPDDYISSIAWIADGNYLAVGNSNSEVQLWDVEQQKKVRSMSGHAARVGALSWNSYILSSGSRSGYVHHHDVRVPEQYVASVCAHSQEVCGLKWSGDGRHLASGGNDNRLLVWPRAAAGFSAADTPVYTLTQHQAAVKALAWCPWQSSLLASGGGTADRHIRFWNCQTGACVNSIDTKSQVCSILWSKHYKELISSHGFALHQLVIWKYPTMTKVAELTGHTARVLHMAMSPDGSTVVSGAADETLRLWKCFAYDDSKKRSASVSSKAGAHNSANPLMLSGIR